GVGGDVDLGVIRERGARIGGAASLGPCLKDDRAETVAGEVRTAHESVVATPDDDRVVAVGCHRARPFPPPAVAGTHVSCLSFEPPVNMTCRPRGIDAAGQGPTLD